MFLIRRHAGEPQDLDLLPQVQMRVCKWDQNSAPAAGILVLQIPAVRRWRWGTSSEIKVLLMGINKCTAVLSSLRNASWESPGIWRTVTHSVSGVGALGSLRRWLADKAIMIPCATGMKETKIYLLFFSCVVWCLWSFSFRVFLYEVCPF